MPVKLDFDGTFLTAREAAEALGLSEGSIRCYCNQKPPKLMGRKVGRDWMIPKAEIDRYKKERNAIGRPHKSA